MQYGLRVATINIISGEICYRDNLDTNQCLCQKDLWGYGQRSRDIFRTAGWRLSSGQCDSYV